MKKRMFLALILALPLAAHASTDAKTIEFMKKLNLYYYCLQREGLRNFTCDVAFKFPPSFKNNTVIQKRGPEWLATMEKLRCKASLSDDGTLSVTLLPPPATGDSATDQAVLSSAESFRKMALDATTSWQEAVVKTLYDERDYSGDCKVQNTADGFTVEVKKTDSDLTGSFTPQAEETSSSGTLGEIPVKSRNRYQSGPKGFIFIGTEGEYGNAHLKVDIENQKVGEFLMPQEIRFAMSGIRAIGGGLEIDLEFSNYLVNQ